MNQMSISVMQWYPSTENEKHKRLREVPLYLMIRNSNKSANESYIYFFSSQFIWQRSQESRE